MRSRGARSTDPQLIQHSFYSKYSFRNIFSEPLHTPVLDKASKNELAITNAYFNLNRVDFRMER